MTYPKIIETKKFFLDGGTAGSISSRFIEILEKETIPVNPIIRKKLIQKIIKILIKLEIQNGKWTDTAIDNQMQAEYEYFLKKKDAPEQKRKRWKCKTDVEDV